MAKQPSNQDKPQDVVDDTQNDAKTADTAGGQPTTSTQPSTSGPASSAPVASPPESSTSEEPRYVATEPLYIGRARAFNAGDTVPAGHIEKYGWAGQVEAQES